MKKLTRLALVLAGAVLIGHSTSVFAQGSLTPPPGAPAPSMKSLDQIEPRTPLGIPGRTNTTTIVITNPGSYVLMGPITVSSGNGITITTNNVNLDLNGFTISSSASPRAGVGVGISGDLRMISVRNGNIASTGSDAISSPLNIGFRSGIYSGQFVGTINFTIGSRVSEVAVGKFLDTGIAAERVEKCSVVMADTNGIAGLLVRDCSVAGYQTGPAISADNIANCTVGYGYSLIGGITGTLVENCTMRGISGGIGIDGVIVKSCYVSAGGAGGTVTPIRATIAIGCVNTVGNQQQGTFNNIIVNKYLMP